MASKVVSINCSKCNRPFRSKLKRGQPTKSCPTCGHSPGFVAKRAKEASEQAKIAEYQARQQKMKTKARTTHRPFDQLESWSR